MLHTGGVPSSFTRFSRRAACLSLLGILLTQAGAAGTYDIPALPLLTAPRWQPAVAQPTAPLPAPKVTITVTPGLDVVSPSAPPASGAPVTALPVAPVSVAPVPGPAAASVRSFLPADPLWPRQWNLARIGLPQAWALWKTQPSSRVTVAVLDTGYVNSPELAGRLVDGYDFVSDPKRAGDGNGRDADATAVGEFAYHGEVVANLIAAAHDGAGMAGIDPMAQIVQVRVAGTDGLIAPQDLADGLRWAVGLAVAGTPPNPNPARIVNLSLYADFIPLTGCDARIQKAIDEVSAKGVLVVAGAANDGKDAAGYSPAGCRNVLTVTSVDSALQRPSYANWGRSVALAAPGGEPGHGVVVSSVSGAGRVRDPNGTSLAAPQVTGVAALLLSVRPKLTAGQLRALLTSQVTPFEAGGCDPDPLKTCGAGLVNAEAALRAALALPR